MKIQSYNHLVAMISSFALAGITLLTFGFALTAIPISGAFCPEGCIDYPYLHTLSQFPGDYLWMFPAMFLLFFYLLFVVSLHHFVEAERKILSHAGLLLALISTAILMVDYFLQFSVVPASLMNEQTEGIPLLTQYNPHGIFIALEDLGYLLMSFSFLFLALALSGQNRLEAVAKWIFFIAFGLAMLAFVAISIRYGIMRKDRFEVSVISINWLVLIVNGILMGLLFRRHKHDVFN
jgi:hypothetical protein